MKTVIEMAREAGAVFPADGSYHRFEFEGSLERFADLIRADALVKPCCGDFDKCQQICMPRAAAQEREACAEIVSEHHEGFSKEHQGVQYVKQRILEAIRARGNK